MDPTLISNLLMPAALGMIALGVGGVSFLGLRAFATANRRRARLAGAPTLPGAETRARTPSPAW